MLLPGVVAFPLRQLFKLGLIIIQAVFLLYFIYAAYDIRLHAIKTFGHIIHEFDPWFNYRAAEYLAQHGLKKFFQWFDYMSWYPIGRPIGTTIYPGMQIWAVAIWEALKHVPQTKVYLAFIPPLRPLASWARRHDWPFIPAPLKSSLEIGPMSVNDICCMIPPWFGSLASIFTGLLAYEISRSVNAGLMATGIMAIIPAHIMRSVGGKFDNEAVAMTAIVMTFWLWLLSIRTPKYWPIGIFTGLSYINMVAAWGGYIFVLNMIGVHALMLVLLGRFNSGVHKAYSIFFFVGTLGAIQIPVVGMQPLRSLEQMGPLLVFIGYQVLAFSDFMRHKKKMGTMEFVKFRIMMCILAGLALIVVAVLLYPTGYFGPLSSRIRGLFVKHTKTGNPLVDSVAEHQPANPRIYATHLGLPLDYALLGGLICLFHRNNGFYFMCLYGFIASHFSGKMSRLVLICGPIVSVTCGIWCGFLLDQVLEPFLLLLGKKGFVAKKLSPAGTAPPVSGDGKSGKAGKTDKAKPARKEGKDGKEAKRQQDNIELEEYEEEFRPGGAMQIKRMVKSYYVNMYSEGSLKDFQIFREKLDTSLPLVLLRAVAAVAFVFYMLTLSGMRTAVPEYIEHCKTIGEHVASPTVMYAVKQKDGSNYIVDDYYKGYKWIEANTPEDSRVMAWWDYGYQITGIANRTTIADGNTWNHEHIATLGRTLTSEVKRAHNAIRHLADYVLVWGGGQRDDLGKSPHLARIGNSVFPDHCGDDDPKCMKFGFYQDRTPTPMMEKSLLYKLVEHNVKKGVKVNEKYFKHVHTTKHGLMRIYEVQNVSQESKDWVADPKNRLCDVPGSWYCPGQYPPALSKLISKRRNFAQIEDFNRKGEKSAYTRLIEKEKGEL
mmetsp:Transcript_71701/g.171253  ORF Transcript_71701/g.171253 Transcript_71701/m.171253 type:complete len:881 (+) Transcript_71701:56-2698(+)|eukprot:CAMPEP_0181406026 /NCGR_PEP_ID=MMETSP1110-20121109/5061_1 /TAXON_ID=174948 /ORGANISM="Symbiodinium sp., Strain CCMP421" /LENGTH=880 /DNA_ID=CAMNT_0023528429 /DNA_START=56 /DNA_END=2698 /DNA_ORIENTATION=+